VSISLTLDKKHQVDHTQEKLITDLQKIASVRACDTPPHTAICGPHRYRAIR
jgi:hypothetical protein